jgi:hypothetical protein
VGGLDQRDLAAHGSGVRVSMWWVRMCLIWARPVVGGGLAGCVVLWCMGELRWGISGWGIGGLVPESVGRLRDMVAGVRG